MEQNGKKINIYRGIWIGALVQILVPIAAFFLLYAVIDRYFDHPKMVTIHICLAYTGIIGACFVGLCFFRGIGDLFAAFLERIRETRELFGGIFNKDGFHWYMHKFLEDGGILIYVQILMILIYAAISVYGFVNFFNWYGPIKG